MPANMISNRWLDGCRMGSSLSVFPSSASSARRGSFLRCHCYGPKHSVRTMSLAKILIFSGHGERVRCGFTILQKWSPPFRRTGGQHGWSLGRFPFRIIGRSMPGSVLSRHIDPFDLGANLDRQVFRIKSEHGSGRPGYLVHLHNNLISRFCICVIAARGSRRCSTRRSRLFSEQVLEICVQRGCSFGSNGNLAGRFPKVLVPYFYLIFSRRKIRYRKLPVLISHG